MMIWFRVLPCLVVAWVLPSTVAEESSLKEEPPTKKKNATEPPPEHKRIAEVLARREKFYGHEGHPLHQGPKFTSYYNPMSEKNEIVKEEPRNYYEKDPPELQPTEDDCRHMAQAGQCLYSHEDGIPKACKTICETYLAAHKQEAEVVGHIESFYNLEAKDGDGVNVKFSEFEDLAVVLSNVENYCESDYLSMVDSWTCLADDSRVQILLFPCAEFTPKDNEHVKLLAEEKGLHNLRMMEHIDTTSLLYQYMKFNAQPPKTIWDFRTSFVYDPHHDSLMAFRPAEPLDLERMMDVFFGHEEEGHEEEGQEKEL